jgi:RHS repeat-associated protein
MGSVKGITDNYGQLEGWYEYDAFGKLYAGELNNVMNLGYTGKPYDTVTGLYNYGYRDYAPEVARFTTMDPIRDGANWFAYVNNDPVNWVDLWGLGCTKASDKEATNFYSNSSTFFTVLPGDVFDRGEFTINVIGATVTTNVATNKNTINVSSFTTKGPFEYNASAATPATVIVDGSVYDRGMLTPQPSILPIEYTSLGGTTLNVPVSGNIEVKTNTIWSIPHDTGKYSPRVQTVTVPIK